MHELKKNIRPGLMRHFLRKAQRLAGEGVAVAFFLDGKLQAVASSDDSFFSPDDPGVFRSALEVGGRKGILALRGSAGHELDSDKATVLLDFLGFTLQGFMDMEAARRSIADEALSKYRELALLHRSVSRFNSSLRLRDVVRSLLNECQRENYPGDKGAVFLTVPDSAGFRLADHFGFTDGAALAELGDCPLFREAAAVGKGEILNNVDLDVRWVERLPGVSSVLLLPIVSPNRCEGILFLASEAEGAFTAGDRKNLMTMATVGGISVSNAFNFEGSQTRMDAMLQALTEAIDSRDPFTAGHSRRVAQLSVAFALIVNEDKAVYPGLYFSEAQVREIYYSGILHDIGKIGIKEEVLTKDSRLPQKVLDIVRVRMQLLGQLEDFEWKPAYERLREINVAMSPSDEQLEYVRLLGSMKLGANGSEMSLLCEDETACLLLPYGNLTPEERMEIQRHPAESERILQHIPLHQGLSNMLTIIRQHHERMDGSGYPDGLRGDDILMQSRMLAIVDVYDAITQERHYKPATPREQALDIIRMESGDGKLDSRFVQLFVDNVERIERIADTISLQEHPAMPNLQRMSMM
ncbi:HD-GYP domain-containing protein [Pseudodesulfovibrio senegalensis]|uniref:HD domain-containing protein n=1 Tax=Pseudodesulfovibrio senegalensis TaxID=1721087 RepID=A0A6N6N3R6_9BACT|nr:HD domain-containing phosphohydrolase [Pseudodesulfovibrio senegalensis]KAB1442890.1 HD domain-containing protein [Pseudodesulfovibrio senegalensis]